MQTLATFSQLRCLFHQTSLKPSSTPSHYLPFRALVTLWLFWELRVGQTTSTSSIFSWCPPATIEERNPGKVYLRHPLSRAAIQQLPENFPSVLDLSKFHVSELFKGFRFRFRDCPWDMFDNKSWCDYPFTKVVLFTNPTRASNPSVKDCTAFVLYNKGHLFALSLETVDRDSKSCFHFITPDNVNLRFDDIVVFEDKVYVIDRKGRAYTISYGSSKMERIVSDPISDGAASDWKKYLVESAGQLYLIYRYNDFTKMNFEVYELDVTGQRWEVVRTLGNDRILFVSADGCFFASAKDLRGWRGNCIVFCKGSFLSYDCRAYNPDSKFIKWKYSDDLGIAVYHLNDPLDSENEENNSEPHHISHYKGYSELFWPPPAWLLSVKR